MLVNILRKAKQLLYGHLWWHDWYPQYVSDHFQNLIRFSVIHILRRVGEFCNKNLEIAPFIISRKSARNVLSYATNRQASKGQNVALPSCGEDS